MKKHLPRSERKYNILIRNPRTTERLLVKNVKNE